MIALGMVLARTLDFASELSAGGEVTPEPAWSKTGSVDGKRSVERPMDKLINLLLESLTTYGQALAYCNARPVFRPLIR